MSENIVLSNLISIAALNASEITTMARVMLDCRKMPSTYIREAFDRLIGVILQRISFSNIKYGHNLTLTALMNIIINLIVVTGQGSLLGYTRNNNTYSTISSLGFDYFTRTKYLGLIDELAENKLVTLSRGYHDKSDPSLCKSATIRPSETLVELMDKADFFGHISSLKPVEHAKIGGVNYVVDPRMNLYTYEWFKNPLLVHIKDEKVIPSTPNKKSQDIIRFLNDYNRFIQQSRLILPSANQAMYDDSLLEGESLTFSEGYSVLLHTDRYTDTYIPRKGKEEEERPESITKTNCCNLLYCSELETRLYRVANNRNLTHGMRFYQPEYQNLKSELRPSLIIGNDAVTEYDYSSFHIRMLYHMEGIDLQEDPYGIFDYNPRLRTAVKLMTNIAINSSSETSAIRAMNDKLFRLNRSGKLDKVVKAMHEANLKASNLLQIVKSKHPEIAQYFNSGIGVELQYKDSMLAESILDHFMRKGVPCLCIHDSFIVPRPYGEELKSVMEEKYKERFNFSAKVDKKY